MCSISVNNTEHTFHVWFSVSVHLLLMALFDFQENSFNWWTLYRMIFLMELWNCPAKGTKNRRSAQITLLNPFSTFLARPATTNSCPLELVHLLKSLPFVCASNYCWYMLKELHCPKSLAPWCSVSCVSDTGKWGHCLIVCTWNYPMCNAR